MKKNEFIGVNEEFIPETDKGNESESCVEKPSRKVFLIWLIPIILVIALMVFIFIITFGAITKDFNPFGSNGSKSEDALDKAFSAQQELLNGVSGSIKQAEDEINQKKGEIAVKNFNNKFDFLYSGTRGGSLVSSLLDTIITNNKTSDRMLTVKYSDNSTSNVEELAKLKSSFTQSKNFEVSFNYGNDGYIYEVIIANAPASEFEIKSFNSKFEIRAGTKSGLLISSTIDEIITSNKTSDRLITVKYLDTSTSDPTEIKTLKSKFKTNTNYELSFEYDDEGFINEAIIENI